MNNSLKNGDYDRFGSTGFSCGGIMSILIQMAGFPGSGKSTLSNMISKNMGMVVLDRDVIKNSMLEAGIEGQTLADASYRVVFELASDLLSKGLDVIIDTPCFYQDIINNGQQICAINDSKYKYIECVVEEYQIINERLKTRKRLQTQIESVSEEKYHASYDKSVKPRDVEFLTIDTSNLDHINIQEIIKYIND